MGGYIAEYRNGPGLGPRTKKDAEIKIPVSYVIRYSYRYVPLPCRSGLIWGVAPEFTIKRDNSG